MDYTISCSAVLAAAVASDEKANKPWHARDALHLHVLPLSTEMNYEL